jgi:CelD/BcsL family acetyltransferase involved in cellulose biosynthesis
MAVLRSIQQLESLAGEWNALADQAGHALLRHEWFLSAASTVHADDEMAIVTERDAGGRLAGVAPLVTRIDRGMSRLELLGSAVLHEPAGILCRDKDSRANLLEAVFALRRPTLLQRVQPGTLPAVPPGPSTGRHGLVISRPAGPCLGIDFDLDPQGYLARLPGKVRYDVRRAHTRAEAAGGLSFDALAPAPAEVDRLFAEFMAVEASGWKGRLGSALALNARLRAFFRFYCQRSAEQGTLRLFRLRIADRVAAVQMAVEIYGRLWILKIGYDETLARCSPGMLLTANTIRYAADRRLDGYEFLGGVEPWEQRWKPQAREYCFVLFYPWTIAGCVGASRDVVGAGWRRMRRTADVSA